MSVSLRMNLSNHERGARPSAFAEATADRRSAARGGWSTGSGRAVPSAAGETGIHHLQRARSTILVEVEAHEHRVAPRSLPRRAKRVVVPVLQVSDEGGAVANVQAGRVVRHRDVAVQ